MDVAVLGFALAVVSLGWNVVNTIRDRRARRRPDVYAAVGVHAQTGASSLVFANAGPAIARGTLYFMVESDHALYGGLDVPYLKADETARVDLPPRVGATVGVRSALVWAFMDIDGNVYVRSNKNDRRVFKRPHEPVDVIEIFGQWYPDIELRDYVIGPPLLLGE